MKKYICLLGLVAGLLAAIPTRAATITWINATGGNWSGAANWSPNRVPGSADTAVVTLAGTYTVTLDVNATVAGLVVGASSGVGTQTFAMNGPTLTLNGQATVNAQGQFNVSNGTLAGAPVLAGTMNWSGGAINAGSTLTVAPNGVLNISGGVSLYGVLSNAGTVNWSGTGNLGIYNYGDWGYTGGIVNQAGAVFNAQNDQTIANDGYGTGYFNNAGLFTKSPTTGTTTINVPLTNTGTVTAQSGVIQCNDGASLAGALQAAATAAISFASGTFTVNGPDFQGPGSVAVTGGNILGTVAGTVNWSGGQINPGSTLTVATNGVLNINGGVSLYGVLTNAGTVNWSGPGNLGIYNYGDWGYTGGIVNQAGAVFNAQNDQTIANDGYGTGYFNNAGLFTKSPTTGTTTINVPLTNTGTVTAQSGTIQCNNGASLAGTLQAAATAAVSLSSGTFTVNGPDFQGPGSVAVTGGNILGTVAGTVNWSGGQINPSTTLTVATNGVLNINGGVFLYGVLTNAGTVNWSGPGNLGIYNYGDWGYTGGIVNQAGAVFNAQNDQTIANDGYGTGYFNNAGLFVKGPTTGTTTFNVVFTGSASGTVQAQSGTILFNNGGNVAGTFQAATNAAVTLSSGAFVASGPTSMQGPGQVGVTGGNLTGTIAGTLNWSGGQINPGVTLTVATNGVLNVVGSVTFYGVLTNAGTVNWSGTGNLNVENDPGYNGTTGGIVNQAGGVFNAQNDQSIVNVNNWYAYFSNAGLLVKSPTAGTTTVNVAFDNTATGLVQAQSGTISFNGGGSLAGNFQAASSAAIDFAGGTFPASSPAFAGPGPIGVSGGSLNFGTSFTGLLSVASGSIGGTVGGTLNWSGGQINAGSWLAVTGGGVLNIQGSVTLYGVLTNAGTVNWSGTGNLNVENNPGYNGTTGGIVNLAGGVFNAQNDQAIVNVNNWDAYFSNAGLLVKSPTTGTTTISVPFSNTGTVAVQSGLLAINTATGSGSFNVAATAGLNCSGLSGWAQMSGAGPVAFGVPANNNLTLTGTMVCTSGTVGASGTLTVSPSAVLDIEGTFNLYGALTNAGTVNWSGTGNLNVENNPGFNGTTGGIINQAGAVFNAQNDQAIVNVNNWNAYFSNAGLFEKSPTTGTTTMGVTFNNTGTVDVESGTVSLTANNTLTAGTLSFGIYGPANYGRLNVPGGVTLGGPLNVTLNNGYLPAISNAFTLVTCGSRSGVFSSLSLPGKDLSWLMVYTNTAVSLVVANNTAPLVSIGYLRSLLDPVNFGPINTTSLFTTEGVVTTWTNLTSSANTEFYIQDATAGIAVYWAGAPGNSLPPAGSWVQVTAPLGEYNGLLALAPVQTNFQEGVTILGSTNLPAPQPLPFDPNITGNTPLMVQQLQGSYFVASNVFLDLSTATLAGGVGEPLTNEVEVTDFLTCYNPTNLTSGTNYQVNATNLAGETFTLYYNPYTDLAGQPKMTGPFNIYGVLGQSAATPPYTNGYQFTPTRLADLVPVAPPTLTWSTPAPVSYGTALSADVFNATATLAGTNVPGTFSYNPSAGTVLNAGSNRLTVIFTPTDPVAYNSAAASVNQVVTPVPLAVAASSATRSYGAANPVLTGTFSGVVNGDNITPTFTTPAGPGSAVGTYPITAGLLDPDGRLANYTVITSNGLLTVTAVPLSVTANNASRLYGQTNPVFTGTLTGVMNGDNLTAIYTCSDTVASPVGTYTITPLLLDPNGRLGNYSVVTNTGTLTVSQTVLSVLWPAPAPIPYGTVLTGVQLAASANIPGAFAYTPMAGTVLNAGTNPLTAVFTPLDTVDFNTVTNTLSLVVVPAPLTVTASNYARPYGQTNPVLEGTLTGVTNGDNITATYATVATSNSPAGDYPIVPTLVDTNNRLANYVVTTTNDGTLTIQPLLPVVTWATPGTIVYGTALDGTQLNATASVPGTLAYVPAAGTVPNAGTNQLTLIFTPTATTIYASLTDTVSVVVTPAPLSVTANNATRPYGQANPALTGTLTGVVNGDNLTATYTCSATPDSLPGQYPVVPSLVDPGNRLGNYSVTSGNGILTVTPTGPQIVLQPSNAMVFPGSNASFQIGVAGTPPLSYQWWFEQTNLINEATNATLVVTTVDTSLTGLYSVIVSNAWGSATSTVVSLTISNVPDLTVTGVGEPAAGQAGQPIQIIYSLTNAGAATAVAPWFNQILLANDAAGDGAQVLGTITFTNSLPAGAGLLATQTVTLPSLVGTQFLGVTVNSGNTVFELNTTNNTAFAASPLVISAPDLVLAQLSAPTSAQFGQAFTVTFTVTNAGGAPAAGAWNDQLYLGASATPPTGAALATLAGTSPLAVGGGYTRTQTVTIPLTTSSTPGTYCLTALADAGNALFEASSTNNALTVPLTLTLPPLPDLTVGQVVSPVTATAGQVIPVSWSVTNAGAATATGPWRDSVYLAPASLTLAQFTANPSAYPLIGSFTDTNVLAAGASATLTESVTVPTIGLAGDVRGVVIVNSDDSLIEQTTANNTALALNDLDVPVSLSLSLTVASVVKNTPTPNINSLLTRNGDLTDAVTVTLASSATNNLLVPASLSFPAGVAAVPFTAVVLDDGQPGPNVPVTLTASADSYQDATAQVLIVNTDMPGLGLTLAASPITEGQTVAATLTSTTVSSQPVVVTLASSSPTALLVPARVTIPANANSTGFTVQAVQNHLIAPAQTYTVSASANGYVASSANLTVLNNNAPTLTLALDRTNLNEADGPLAAVATVTRQPVTSQAVTISLGSTNPGAATVPTQVTIQPLQASATFYVSAVDDTNATGPELTLITAQTLDNAGELVGAAATQSLAVQDNQGPVLHLTLTYKVVPKGAAPATVAAVWTTTPPASDLVVTLDSSDPNEAMAPATVILPAGQTNVTFAVSSVDDGLTGTSQTVCFTASATNYASGSDVLTVTDSGQPELMVQNITAPGAAYNGEPMTIGFQLINQGLGTLTNPIAQNIYLTTNPVSGNNRLLGVTAFAGTLAFGESDCESVVIPGSAMPAPGTYWLVVAADVNDDAPELNQAYNTTISARPVVIAPEYSAVVTAGVTNVMMGTPVPLSGSATMTAGGPATNVPVNLLVTVRGLQRVLGVYTDAHGHFNTVFTPLANEAGAYTVSAVPPGVTSAPAQTQFNLLGLALNPPSLTLGVTAGSSVAASVGVQNLSDAPLTSLTATVNGLAANLNVNATLGDDELDGLGTVTLTLNLSAADVSVPQSAFTVHLTSAEGVALDLPVTVTVNPLTPQLVVVPSQLSDSMLVGGQTLEQFQVVNVGGAASGPLTVSLPSVPWMSLATANPLPSLAPGQTNQVTLVLTPGTNLALGPYAGNLAVNGQGVGVQLPFTFNAVSDAHGALLVQAVDEYTFYAAGAPPLTNASVTLTDPFSGAVVASGVTDANGLFLAPGLLAGAYNLALTASQHASYSGSAVVSAGQTNTLQAFLPLQTVTYTWTVVPTQIQDQTEITIQATYQTDVPAPVIVPSPTSIDLSSLTTPGQFLDIPLTLANYGLISVSNVNIAFNSSELYEFDLLTTNVGALPAHGTVTVPLRITLLANGVTTSSAAVIPASPPAAQAGTTTVVAGTPSGGCYISLAWGYSYPCGPFGVTSGAQVAIVNYQTACPGAGGGASGPSTHVVGPPPPHGGADNGGNISYPPPVYGTSTVCDCSILPLPCAKGSIGFNLGGLAAKLVASLTKMLPDFTVKSVSVGVSVSGEVCVCCKNDQYGISSTAQGSANINVVLTAGPSLSGELPFHPSGNWADANVSLDALLGVQVTLSGSISATLEQPCLENPKACLSGSASLTVFAGASISGEVSAKDPTSGITYSGSVSGQLGLQGSGTAGIQGCLDSGITSTLCGKISAVASLSGELSAKVPVGTTGTNTVTVKNSIDLNANVVLGQAGSCGGGEALITALDDGLDDPVTNTDNGPIVTNIVADDFLTSQADLLTALGMDTAPKVGVCAQIQLQLSQSAVLTENAFLATFQLGNQGASPLTNISVNLAVQNQAGQDVTSLFGLQPPSLSGGMTAVDGTGALAAGGTGTAQWTLIPGLAAAPQVPTNYLVSGTFSYTQNGTVITIPLAAEPISVQPSPQLYLKYFLQRDVYADDPFTPEIEPSIPFPLALMVQNQGYGTAYNFHITSAQPQIVDNAKGLLIDFKITGTEVDGQSVSPSLTVNFGDVAPGSIEIGEWWLTSSLEGLFTACSATFQNADSQGNLQISPIQGVEIHEITHMVRADGAWDDGQPDFLAIDTNDVHSLPNLLYLSDGSVQPVSVVQTGASDGPPTLADLTVQFTANFPAGFTYVLVPDPANGQFPLQSVLYANGNNFLTNNFWITDRTFIGQGHPPLLQTNLHLFVYHTNAGPDTFTLVYGPPTILTETNPPESAVFSLPAVSPQTFGVVWSGANYVGGAPVAYYDIYVSDNGGPFTDWQPQTTGTGALFTGVAGHTYAFYSVATDTAGHREATPVEPQAQTTVLGNTVPPTITLASTVTLTAGQTLSLSVTASSGNPQNTLTFSLGAGAPAGVVVNPASGQLTWATSPAFAGTTNYIRVIATDNGQPPLSATGTVAVILPPAAQPTVPAPVASVYNISRTPGLAALIYWSNLATNWSDASGAPVTLAGLNLTTTNGVTLQTNSSVIYYPATAPNVNDQISYTIAAQGGTNTGLINVIVNPFVVGLQSPSALNIGANSITATFRGIPGFSFQVQRSTNLVTGTGWVTISTNTVDANGLLQVTDPCLDLGGQIPPAAYYRLIWNP